MRPIKVAIARIPRFREKYWGIDPVILKTTIIGAKLKKTVPAALIEVSRTATIWLRLRCEPDSTSRRYITGMQVAKLAKKRKGMVIVKSNDR